MQETVLREIGILPEIHKYRSNFAAFEMKRARIKLANL